MKNLNKKDLQALEALKALKKELSSNKRLCVCVTYTTRSGLTKYLKFYHVKKNKIKDLTYLISKSLNYSCNKKGVRISFNHFVNMDMIFQTLYKVNLQGIKFNLIKKSKSRTLDDLKYSGLVDTEYTYLW